MENILEKFGNCNDPEEFISLMFENTDKETGMLCFQGLIDLDDPDAVYRFHMNWNEKDRDAVIKESKELVESLTELAKIDINPEERNVEDVIKDEKLMNIWNIYVRPFAEECTAEVSSILEKEFDLMMVEPTRREIRKKMDNNEELSDVEYEIFEEYKDIMITDEEEKILDSFWEARRKEADDRLGKSIFSLNLLIQAKRTEKLIKLKAPEIIYRNEVRELMTAMALHKYCDSQEKI